MNCAAVRRCPVSSRTPALPVRNDEFYKPLMVEALAALVREYPHPSRFAVIRNYVHGLADNILRTMQLDKRLSQEVLNAVADELAQRSANDPGGF